RHVGRQVALRCARLVAGPAGGEAAARSEELCDAMHERHAKLPSLGRRSERGDQLHVELALRRRAPRLQTVVYTDQPRRPLEADAEADTVSLVLVGSRAGPILEPGEGPGVVPEERHVLAAPAREPARLGARQAVAVDAERLLVEAAQRGGAAEREALE